MITFYLTIFLLVVYIIYLASKKLSSANKLNVKEEKKSEKVAEVKIEKIATWGTGSCTAWSIIAVVIFWGTIMGVCTLNFLGVISVDWSSLGKNIWQGIKFVVGLGIIYLVLSTLLSSFKKKEV